MDEVLIDNVTEFVLNSFNSDGGFKSYPTGDSSSLSSTFYAIQTLYYLDSLDMLSSNKTLISEYINQFYVDDPLLEAHYGGYSYNPNSEIPFATIRATFEAFLTLKATRYLNSQSEKQQQTGFFKINILKMGDSLKMPWKVLRECLQ